MKTAREMAHLVLGWKGHAGGCFGCGEHQAICDDATAAIEARDAEWRVALGVATAALEKVASQPCAFADSYGNCDDAKNDAEYPGVPCDTCVADTALTEISDLLASQPTGEAR